MSPRNRRSLRFSLAALLALASPFALFAGDGPDHDHGPAAPSSSDAAPVVKVAPAAEGASGEAAGSAPVAVSAEQANAAFERFKALEGAWAGKSTKGWSDSGTWRVIAGGSVAMHSSFDAHPGETMVTMVHPDGDRLVLTHYCVARNQPRLVLSKVENDGARLTFEWLDGTNLRSRDQGHMDKVVYDFRPDGSHSSRWTWYQKGSESWMEEIVNVRAEEAEAAQGAPMAMEAPERQ